MEKVLFFDAKQYDIDFFNQQKEELSKNNSAVSNLEFEFLDLKLNEKTVSLAYGKKIICAFVNDRINDAVIENLSKNGTELLALRCAGYNNVSLKKAQEVGLKVVRVPEYSPYAVAEHAVALIMTLNRHVHKAYSRVRDGNFSLNGLIGFDMHGKTVGVIGTGRIGQIMIKIIKGFGCKVLAFDLYPQAKLTSELGFEYVALEEIYKQSDIISLHVPLSKETYHMINQKTIELMKDKVILINTSRGPLIDTQPVIDALKSGKIKAAGLDVYEEEEKYFFEDLSNEVVVDDQLARLLSFNNVIVTSHQAFLTEEALRNIAATTIDNILEFVDSKTLTNEVKL